MRTTTWRSMGATALVMGSLAQFTLILAAALRSDVAEAPLLHLGALSACTAIVSGVLMICTSKVLDAARAALAAEYVESAHEAVRSIDRVGRAPRSRTAPNS